MSRTPKMIGAHVPTKSRQIHRLSARQSAKMLNAAFDTRFCATRPHLVMTRELESPRR